MSRRTVAVRRWVAQARQLRDAAGLDALRWPDAATWDETTWERVLLVIDDWVARAGIRRSRTRLLASIALERAIRDCAADGLCTGLRRADTWSTPSVGLPNRGTVRRAVAALESAGAIEGGRWLREELIDDVDAAVAAAGAP